MIVRAGTGWQTTLADLSLILFMVTASAVSQSDKAAKAARPAASISAPSPEAEPLAVYRASGASPSLADWLADQPRDPRQMLTIHAPYGEGGQTAALAAAAALARQAGARGLAARIVIEPGEGLASATLAYDLPLAQSLQSPGGNATVQGHSR